MKNLVITVFICIISLLSLQAFAEPAYVVKEFDCPGFIPDPVTGAPIAPLYTTETQAVGVLGKVGKITCHFDHDYPLEQASAARGWPCIAEGPLGNPIYTENSVMLATPGGKALLECKFGPTKGKPQPPAP